MGLPGGGRRRTPGLRREEVALLAGVGVSWYTWLEQGRDIAPSEQVLEAIARVLLLEPDERDHLWLLAKGHRSAAVAPDATCQVITSDHLTLLSMLLPTPACIQTANFDILAANAGYRFLIDDLDQNPPAERNCLVRAFLDPRWRAAYVEYEEVTARMVARLRAALPQHLDDPSWTGLVDRMRAASTHFDELWRRHDLALTGTPVTVFDLRRVGRVTVRFTRLWLEGHATVHLNVLQPAGEADAAAFRRILAALPDQPAVTARPAVTAVPPTETVAARTAA